MKTIIVFAMTALLASGGDEDYWGERLREGIERRERHSERIERDWNFRQQTEQRERQHREEMEQREEARKEQAEQNERIRQELEDARREQRRP